MASIPKSFRKYFWDININNIDLKKHQVYVIERLLEYGDVKAYRWLNKNFRKTTIAKIAARSRRLSPQTKNFWAAITSYK